MREPIEDFVASADEADQKYGDWYNLAYENFENISCKLTVLMAASREDWLEWFLEVSHRDDDLFLTLGYARFTLEHDPDFASACPLVGEGLNQSWGPKWVRIYQEGRSRRRFPGKP